MPGFGVQVSDSGPLFNGVAQAVVNDYCRDLSEELAEEAKDQVLLQLGRVLRHPTGYYESRIRTVPESPTRWRVDDDMVIYGPWLEGTGSRNKTTRFKGYFTFRLIGQVMQGRARSAANALLPTYLRRIQ